MLEQILGYIRYWLISIVTYLLIWISHLQNNIDTKEMKIHIITMYVVIFN